MDAQGVRVPCQSKAFYFYSINSGKPAKMSWKRERILIIPGFWNGIFSKKDFSYFLFERHVYGEKERESENKRARINLPFAGSFSTWPQCRELS